MTMIIIVMVNNRYGTQFVRVPQDKSRWQRPRPASLQLPAPNPYIPTNLDLKLPVLPPPPDGPAPPTLVFSSDTWRVFIKPDTTYGKPRGNKFGKVLYIVTLCSRYPRALTFENVFQGYAYFNIALPDSIVGSEMSPRTTALSRLYDLYLSEALTELTYDAALAGMSYSFGISQRGVILSVSGFNDKLPAFIDTVAAAVVAYVPTDEGKLAKFKDVLSRNFQAFTLQQPYLRAAAYARQCEMKPSTLPTDSLADIDSISLAELQTWVRVLWRRGGFGQALVQGNFREEEALACAQTVVKAFALRPLAEDERGAPKFFQLPVTRKGYGNVLVREDPNNTDNANSAVLVQFQNGAREDLRGQLAMEVLGAMMANPFFTELRTQQQLGYIVNAGATSREGVRSLVFTVQSSVAGPPVLTRKVFEFVDAFSLEQFSDKSISTYVQGLVQKKLQKDKRLTTEISRHWSEIVLGRYDYQRATKEAAILKTLTRADLQEVLGQVLLPGGAGRRVLTTQVYASSSSSGSSDRNAVSKVEVEGGVVVRNITQFVAQNALFAPYKGNPHRRGT
jgi:insulysin